MIRALPPAPVPRPAIPPEPFEVRMRDSVGGCVLLTGYDDAAAPAIEVRIPRRNMSHKVVRHIESWCRAAVDAPFASSLGIVRGGLRS